MQNIFQCLVPYLRGKRQLAPIILGLLAGAIPRSMGPSPEAGGAG